MPLHVVRLLPGQWGRVLIVALLSAASLVACVRGGAEPPPLRVGLVAPLSGGSAASGEAILRGMLLAMDEINAAGGVLGRRLELVARDVQNDPPAGDAAFRELVKDHQVVAVFGGIFSPVMLAMLDAAHELQTPLINPWGSMSSITRNGRTPNYAFRVSVSDAYASEFLARYAVDVLGARRPAVLADTSAWGAANAEGVTDWLERLATPSVALERFDQGDTDLTPQLTRVREVDPDLLLMVANAPEGAAIRRGMATLGWDVPVVSHWGITGGKFVELAGSENAEGVLVLQTFSFSGPLSPKAAAVRDAYHRRFGTREVEEITAPVGVAHGYDGVRLLAMAIRKAGTAHGPALRDALEHLDPYDGLVKRYAPAFTPDNHDAFLADDYLMAVWRNGRLVPAPRPGLR